MFPTLFQIGPLAISSMGFFLFLAFLTSAFLIWQKGREENFDAEPLLDSVILVSLAGLLGARIIFFIFSPEKNLSHFVNFFRYPGFSFFGGMVGGFLFLVYFCKKHKLNIYKLLDVYVFGILAAQILIRVGNFLDGSYYGKPTSLPWGIAFPGLYQPVQPVNLYEIIFLLGLFFLIKRLERRYRLFDWYKNKRGEAAPGFLFLVYLLFYSVFRFLLEFLRNSSLYWGGLDPDQWTCLFLIIVSLLLFYTRSGRGVKDILDAIKFGIQKHLFRKKEKELKVLIPVAPERKPITNKRKFHIKAGMDAEKK